MAPEHPHDNHGATRSVRIAAPLVLALLVAFIDVEFFTHPLPPTVQPQEILWTEFSLIGLLFQAGGLIDAVSDYAALRRDGRNGARKIVAMNAMRSQLVACVMHILFLTIGAVAMTQLPPNADHPLTLTGIVLTGVLFGSNAILVWNAIMQRRSRAKLEAYIARAEAATLARAATNGTGAQGTARVSAALVAEGRRQTQEGNRQTNEANRQTLEGERQTVEGQRLDKRRADMDDEEHGS